MFILLNSYSRALHKPVEAIGLAVRAQVGPAARARPAQRFEPVELLSHSDLKQGVLGFNIRGRSAKVIYLLLAKGTLSHLSFSRGQTRAPDRPLPAFQVGTKGRTQAIIQSIKVGVATHHLRTPL